MPVKRIVVRVLAAGLARAGRAVRSPLLAAVLSMATACGATPSSSAAEPAVLRFGLTADYPPFAWRDASGALRGADVQAASRVAAALGARAEFVPTTWTTLEADFAAGRFDVLIGGITVTAARAALGRYSVTLMEDGKRPLVRCEDRERFGSLGAIDQPGVRLMVNRGPAMGEFATRRFPRAALTVNRDDETLIPFLLERRADVWITDGVVVDHMARRHAGRLCATAAPRLAPVSKAWLLRGDAVRIAAIDRALDAQLRSGAWRRDLEAAP